MIKRFIDKLLGKPAVRVPLGKRVDVPASEHGIDHSLVDEHAIKVVSTLQQAGHQAYIVGGAVRDLLVGRRPKDFDVATDATPEQVKALFRRAFIIGRRFRLVHVVFGRGREHPEQACLSAEPKRSYLHECPLGPGMRGPNMEKTLLEPGLQFPFQGGQGHCAGDAMGFASALEQDQGGDPADAEAGSQMRLLIRVDLDDGNAALPLAREIVQAP